MRTLLRILTGALAIFVVALVCGYFVLRRDDIPFATLEARYGDASSRYAELSNGVRAHYRIEGNATGPTLLLIHGQSTDAETWRPWIRQLGGKFQLLSVDLPGHGLTQAPNDYQPSMAAFANLIDELTTRIGLDKITIVGHSMGGHVAWTFAQRYPQRVNSLVLIASGGMRPPASGGSLAILGTLVEVMGPVLADIDPTFGLKMAMQASVSKAANAESALARAAELACAPGHREIAMAIHLSRTQESNAAEDEQKLATIEVPTLIIWGEDDAVAPLSYAEKFGSLIVGSQVRTYRGVGHAPQIEAAEKTAADLAEFLVLRNP